MSFTSRLPPAALAEVDQDFASTMESINVVISKMRSKSECRGLEGYLRALVALPPEMDKATMRRWLCAAFVQLAELDVEK